MIRDYVALDLETSGLNPSENQIIEIGMAKVCDGRDYRNLQPSVKSEGEAVAADCGTDPGIPMKWWQGSRMFRK